MTQQLNTEDILDEIAARAYETEKRIWVESSAQARLSVLWGIGDWIANNGKKLRVRTPEEIHRERRPRVWYELRYPRTREDYTNMHT